MVLWARARVLEEDRTDFVTELLLGQPMTGASGAVITSALQFGLGYSSTKCLVNNFNIAAETWLVLPAGDRHP